MVIEKIQSSLACTFFHVEKIRDRNRANFILSCSGLGACRGSVSHLFEARLSLEGVRRNGGPRGRLNGFLLGRRSGTADTIIYILYANEGWIRGSHPE